MDTHCEEHTTSHETKLLLDWRVRLGIIPDGVLSIAMTFTERELTVTVLQSEKLKDTPLGSLRQAHLRVSKALEQVWRCG